jgi:hypothetical protein
MIAADGALATNFTTSRHDDYSIQFASREQ